MAKSIEQQIADTKKRLAEAKKAAAAANVAAKDAKASKEVRAQADNLRKYVAELEKSLNGYIGDAQIFITKVARGDKLSVLEKDEFDNIQKNINKIGGAIATTRDKITTINLPGAKDVKTPTNQTVVEKPKPLTAAKPSTVAGAKPDTAVTSGVAAGAKLDTGITSGGKKSSSDTTASKVVPSGFNVGSFRAADEASMAKANGVTPTATGVKTPLDTLLAKTDFWYDLPDYIFKLDPKLGELLVQAVSEGWDDDKFLSKAKLTPWWQKNAPTIRTRIIDRAKYDELKAAGEDVSKSDYGLYLKKQMNAVKAKAKEIAGVTLTDEQAQSVASKIYDGFLDDDPLAINALITPFIGKVSSIVGTGTQTGFSGQALQNYQTLQAIAKANGFTIKDILPNISTATTGGDLETAVLQSLANGDIDINRVAQDARMLASQGQPQYVRGLLSQGYDLENIYAPYRQTMASVLEVDPNTIDLNDNTLRMAITDKGDMNLYDFKKALRQDNRWQYTGAAKEEVSNAALKVLQDFGFQG